MKTREMLQEPTAKKIAHQFLDVVLIVPGIVGKLLIIPAKIVTRYRIPENVPGVRKFRRN